MVLVGIVIPIAHCLGDRIPDHRCQWISAAARGHIQSGDLDFALDGLVSWGHHGLVDCEFGLGHIADIET
ncbi:hypothetical protein SDC9_80935 [bioreactor metagenome]|uniref:Uncharacterized protein n=1 Tax=bioreactor metagenome TaxID=1076179 RepID=A0A644Z6K8_9ZZZZ